MTCENYCIGYFCLGFVNNFESTLKWVNVNSLVKVLKKYSFLVGKSFWGPKNEGEKNAREKRAQWKIWNLNLFLFEFCWNFSEKNDCSWYTVEGKKSTPNMLRNVAQWPDRGFPFEEKIMNLFRLPVDREIDRCVFEGLLLWMLLNKAIALCNFFRLRQRGLIKMQEKMFLMILV